VLDADPSSSAQIVEITRALARGHAAACCSTSLRRRSSATVVRRLFERVRALVAGGVAVLYISHQPRGVFEICQDVAVIRDGELVLTAPHHGS